MRDKIEKLLLEGRQFEAWFIASQLSRHSEDSGLLDKANFNPLEPRDARGSWATQNADEKAASPFKPVQYRGHFHDLVVDDILTSLKRGGSKVLKNVDVLGLNGIVAIPDGVSKPKGFTLPYFIEVKTGNDPDFTKNQTQVYPLICAGGHATSFDTRIADLGLLPGAPFPPMDILLVLTSGPGEPIKFIDYCRQLGFRVR